METLYTDKKALGWNQAFSLVLAANTVLFFFTEKSDRNKTRLTPLTTNNFFVYSIANYKDSVIHEMKVTPTLRDRVLSNFPKRPTFTPPFA